MTLTVTLAFRNLSHRQELVHLLQVLLVAFGWLELQDMTPAWTQIKSNHHLVPTQNHDKTMDHLIIL